MKDACFADVVQGSSQWMGMALLTILSQMDLDNKLDYTFYV